MSQSVPDRSLVGEFTKIFIDSLYLTPQQSSETSSVTSVENHREAHSL